MKATPVLIGAVALGPLLLIAPLSVALVGAKSAQARTCSRAGAHDVDSAAVAEQVSSILNGRGKGSVSVPGLDEPAEQIPNAKAIQTAGVALKVPARGQVVALATALQESGLRNLGYGDRDSLGLFQQRPSQGWGTAAQVRDPVHAATQFYESLLRIPGWQSMTVAQAAQAVQKSGFPGAYAKWESLATALQSSVAGSLSTSSGSSSESVHSASTGLSVTSAGCDTEAGGTGVGAIPAGALPHGYTIPAAAPKSVRAAIRWGLGQLGTGYQWGGACSDPHARDPMGRCDCSSLMQAAYKAGGVSLSRTTYTQVKEGKAVSVDALEPGDLLFTRGSADAPEHVGMFVGRGLILQAPRTGDVVKLSPLADWRSEVLAARRIV